MKDDIPSITPDKNPEILEEQKRDHAIYFVKDGEEGFSPAWNTMVIEKTIKKAEALRRKRQKEYHEQLAERADAVATYLKSRKAEGNTPIEKYFGKQTLAYLQGRRIMDRVRTMQLHQKVARKGVKPGTRKVYLPD